jgi:hypothetical protein
VNDQLTTLLHDRAARLDVSLPGPGQVRRAALHKRAIRRRNAAALAVATGVMIALLAVVNPLVGARRTHVPVAPPAHSTRFAGLPSAATPASVPADGRLVLNISPESGATWNVYADGRIIWQRWSSRSPDGDPLVIPPGADPSQTTYVQQRLTPHGVQLLVSRILATGQAVGLFGKSMALGNSAFDEVNDFAAWYQVCNNGHLIHAQVLPPAIMQNPRKLETPAQMSALAQITNLVGDPSSLLPASAWADRTIRPYVPSHYLLVFDRHAPDPSKLPSPAKEVLAQFQPLLHNADQTVPTDQARALIAALAGVGVKAVNNHASDLGFDVPAVGDGNHTILEFRPAVPSSPLTDHGQC